LTRHEPTRRLTPHKNHTDARHAADDRCDHQQHVFLFSDLLRKQPLMRIGIGLVDAILSLKFLKKSSRVLV